MDNVITIKELIRLIRNAVIAYPMQSNTLLYPNTFAVINDMQDFDSPRLGLQDTDLVSNYFFSRQYRLQNNPDFFIDSNIISNFPLVGLMDVDLKRTINKHKKEVITTHEYSIFVAHPKNGDYDKLGKVHITELFVAQDEITNNILSYLLRCKLLVITNNDDSISNMVMTEQEAVILINANKIKSYREHEKSNKFSEYLYNDYTLVRSFRWEGGKDALCATFTVLSFTEVKCSPADLDSDSMLNNLEYEPLIYNR